MNTRNLPAAVLMVAAMAGCTSSEESRQTAGTEEQSGEALVAAYCVRCHQAPQPADLPQETWPVVLGWMGNFLGIHDYSINDTLGRDYIGLYSSVPGMVLERPIISAAQFEKLKAYLIDNAKPEAALVSRRGPLPEVSGFEVVIPKLDLPPNNLLLGLLVDGDRRRLYTGSGLQNHLTLSAFDTVTSKRLGAVDLDAVPRYITSYAGGLRVGTINLGGEIPSKTYDVSRLDAGKAEARAVIDDGCIVQTVNVTKDMDGDGHDDIVSVCYGAGAHPGRVSVHWGTPDGKFRRTDLMEMNLWWSVVDGLVDDFNRDGKPDILLYFVDGYQKLTILLNQGGGEFEQHDVQSFRPSAGGLSVATADFNGDDYPDIVLTLGNNEELRDLKPVRPYHGIYVFENNRDLSFTQKLFYHMQGAVKAVTGDFDGDGRIDIAAVANEVYTGLPYAESFVYLHNQGDWQFSAATLPAKYEGRWINLAKGDVTGDGLMDIVLGDGSGYPWSAPKETAFFDRRLGDRKEYPPVLYLVNKAGAAAGSRAGH